MKNKDFDINDINKLLIDRGIRPSIQRIKILEYIVKNKNHPTVDMIFNALKGEIPTLSKTTVYNTLNEMVKKDVLLELIIDENAVRYDLYMEPHVHFKCRICGEIYDYDMDCEIFKKKKIKGNLVERYSVNLYGICKNCLNERSKKNGD